MKKESKALRALRDGRLRKEFNRRVERQLGVARDAMWRGEVVKAYKEIFDVLTPLNHEQRCRVLKSVAILYDCEAYATHQPLAQGTK